MKRLWLFLLVFITMQSMAQFGGQQEVTNPLKWHTSVEKTGTDTYNLIIEADIEDGWHLYSQFNDPMGSLPIEFEWKNAKNNYEVIGKAKEIGTHQAYNKVFKVTETFFSKHAKLIQPVKVLNPNLKKIEVTLYGQTCKESCIQVKENLSFDLTKAKKTTNMVKKNETPSKKQSNGAKSEKNASAGQVNKTLQENNAVKTNEKPHKNTEYTSVPLAKDSVSKGANTIKQAEAINQTGKNTADNQKPLNPWSVFWWTFLAGLVVLLTPCVFPMIPLTISFFTKQSEKGSKGKFNAIVYALSIILIYVALSLPFHLINNVNSSFLNNFSTNTYVNLFFFAIFFIFALNLFGVEKLDPVRIIPNSWVSSADKKSNKGGILAGFFMALTLVIVSFSCTGPALGLILGNVLSTDGGPTLLTIAMFGFGLGIALPFGILAFIPSLLHKLPQSGAWLNSVKVIFGFIELAFAFKFLSNADLVNQWHFLHREMFIAIWIAISFTMAMYLFGKLTLSHDAPVQHIGVFRFLLGLASLTFGFYLLPGLWGAPLSVISGFPPPMKYAESPYGVGNTQKHNFSTGTANILPEGAEYGPNNIIIFENDYDKALAYAKKTGKPLMLDFTGRACQNCRLMEENVWSKDKILPILKNDVVLVSLYVDERTPLPENEQYISKFSGDKIETIGDKWSEMETYIYKNNSQPYYVILNHKEEKMNEPVGYTPDVDEYYKWLKKGIENFKKKHQK